MSLMIEPEEPMVDLEKARRLMSDQRIDLLVASERFNIAYLGGYPFHYYIWPTHNCCYDTDRLASGLDHDVFVGLPCSQHQEPFLVETEGELKNRIWIKDIRRYSNFPHLNPTKTSVQALGEAILDRGLGSGTIGIDLPRTPSGVISELKTELPGLKLVDATDLIWELRLIKSPQEIARMKKALEITKQSRLNLLNYVEPGVDCFYLFKTLVEYGLSQEATLLYLQMPEKVLEYGDMLNLDIGYAYRGYTSDISRMAVIGSFNDEERRIQAYIEECRDAVVEAIKPGVTASDLFWVGNKVMGKHNYQLRHAGHGLGLSMHERPSLISDDHTVLRAGMTLTIEIVHDIKLDEPRGGWGQGLSWEEVGVVTEDGFRWITDFPEEDWYEISIS